MTDRLPVVSVGAVTTDEIDAVEMLVERAPGAGNVDVNEATLKWIGPQGSADVTSDDQVTWTLRAIAVDSRPEWKSTMSDGASSLPAPTFKRATGGLLDNTFGFSAPIIRGIPLWGSFREVSRTPEAQARYTMRSYEGWERGQVGIGTLIVFIGMVLVAAIAAGVLINTAGFLQTDAEKTGQQSSEQVTDRVQVISETGILGDPDNDGGNEVDELEIQVKRAPGAGDIDLAEATVHYIGPAGAADFSHTDTGGDALSAGASNFATDSISGSGTSLADDSDVIKITIKGDNDGSAMDGIEPGDTASLEISTADGGTSHVSITVPESLSGESAVSV